MSQRALYHLAFMQNCHRWLAAGYAMLDSGSLSSAQEPSITGELVRTMKEVKLRPDAPAWMIRLYVADDPPINTPGKLGKRRKRVDIEFERSSRGVAFHFHFEAKRLYRSDSLSEYLGDEGLGMFLSGDYASDERVGGMLGYVQRDSLDAWLGKLQIELGANPPKYEVTDNGAFTLTVLVKEFAQTHRSIHHRRNTRDTISIYHTLLPFVSKN